MKKIFTILTALVTVMMLSACSSGMSITFEKQEKKPIKEPDADKTVWSVFVYMCSDNNGRASEAIKELCSMKYTENINVVVETGGSSVWGIEGISGDYIQRYEMQDGAPYLVDQKPDASMGDYNTFAEFLEWGTKNYPADKNVLVIMGEGDGLNVVNDTRHENDSLSVEDVYYSISLSDTTFDIIGFDGGAMASLEMAAALSPYGKYMIADQERGIGWDYKHIAECIMEYPYMSDREFAQIIVDSAYAKAMETDWSKMMSMSVIDLSRVSDVLQAFNSIASGMYSMTDTISDFGALQRNINTAMRCVGTSQVDIGSLARAVENTIGEGTALMNEALNSAVVYKAIGEYRADSSGISVFYPKEVNEKQIISYMNCATSDSYKKYIKSISPYINAHDDYVTQDYNSSGAWQEYSQIPVGGTAFVDANKKFCFTVEPDMRALKDVSINRYMYYGDTDSYYSIGNDANIDCKWDERTYVDNMETKALMIKNVPLDVKKEDSGSAYKIYSSQIIVDDVLSTMYMAYSVTDGKYEVLGVFRNGAYTEPKFGTVISPVYRVYQSDKLLTGRTVRAGFNINVKNKPLKNGTYIYEYELQDVYNRLYKSGVTFMDKKGTEEIMR